MKKVLLIMLIALSVSMTGTASAVIIDLNYSNLTGLNGTYATVDLTQDTTNLQTFHFIVTPTANYLMRNFYFNTDIAGLTTANIINISSASPAYSAVVFFNNNADGFGQFDIKIGKNGQHNVSELTFDLINVGIGKTVNDFIQLSDGSAGHGLGHFAAQILFNASTGVTGYVRDSGTRIPEPSALLLLGSGLLGFALYNRRRFNK
jgi:hypothetical protein